MATHICGTAEEATGPSTRHYQWHRYYKTPLCGKAIREDNWFRAEKRAGHSLPEWPPPKFKCKCGTAGKATGPSQKGYNYHRSRGETACAKSKREAAWYSAEQKAGHMLLDYQPTKNMEGYKCGETGDAVEPQSAHYAWDLTHKGKACDKARAEVAWYRAQIEAGYPLPDYKPRKNNWEGWECGPADAATGPSQKHYGWHFENGTEPCGLSLAENAWRAYELRTGKPAPDYKYKDHHGGAPDWDAPTCVYQHTFLDGDRYYGISAEPHTRWLKQRREPTPLGDKMRSGAIFITEVLCVAPNRRMAEEIEKIAIKAGNPWGSLLNVAHNKAEING